MTGPPAGPAPRPASGSPSRSISLVVILREVDLAEVGDILRTASPGVDRASCSVASSCDLLLRASAGSASWRRSTASRYLPIARLPAHRLSRQQRPAGAPRRARPVPLPRRPRGHQPDDDPRHDRRGAGRRHGRRRGDRVARDPRPPRPRPRRQRGARRARRDGAARRRRSPCSWRRIGCPAPSGSSRCAERWPRVRDLAAQAPRRAGRRRPAADPRRGARPELSSPGAATVLAFAAAGQALGVQLTTARRRSSRPASRSRRRSRPGRATSARSTWRPSRSRRRSGSTGRRRSRSALLVHASS